MLVVVLLFWLVIARLRLVSALLVSTLLLLVLAALLRLMRLTSLAPTGLLVIPMLVMKQVVKMSSSSSLFIRQRFPQRILLPCKLKAIRLPLT
nr:MAG TPA: hypothetical protein [Caudoviricetes sp.]